MVGMVLLLVLIGIIVLMLKVISTPIKIIIKLAINGISGLVLLFLINIASQKLGINLHIPLNVVTVLIAGFLGLPGVFFLIIFNTLM